MRPSNVLAHAVLRLSEQCAVLYVPIREREEDAIARLIRAEMDGKLLEDPEEQQVETIRATMRLKQRNLGIFVEDNMTMDLLTGCFAVEGREDDATFAESHCNADALVCILHGDQADKDDVKLIYRRVFSWSSMR